MADVELTTAAQEAAIDPAADKFPYIDVSLTPDATRYATVDNMLAAVDASTTEALTGTSAVVAVTPNALAALWEQGSDIASAGTISVGEGGYFNVTGTTTITDIDFATDKAGRKVWLKFAGILTLTHHGTTLILPTGANIVTAAGDIACFISEGSDNVRCVSYTRASGAALVGGGASSPMTLTSGAAGDVPLTINAHASQTASLQEWKNSGGTNKASIKANGTFRGDESTGDVFVEAQYFSAVYQLTARPNNSDFGFLEAGVGFFFMTDTSGKNNRTKADYQFGWSSSTTNAATAADTGVKRTIAGVVGITDGSTGGGAIGMQEQTAPAAPAANGVYLYAVDNGSGKTQFMAIFSSGAAQQIAIQP